MPKLTRVSSEADGQCQLAVLLLHQLADVELAAPPTRVRVPGVP